MNCLKFPALVSVIALSCLPEAARAADLPKTSPNVLLIYTDDQGYGDAGCLNADSRFPTPGIDRLAEEGLCFTDAHSSDTVCTPSRYGLLAGRYSWRTELKRGVFGAERKCLLADGRLTIASFLRARGYHTALIGKWHLGMDFPGDPGRRDWSQPVRDMPLDKGFDYFYGIPASLNYGILAWFEGRYAETPPTLFTAKKPNAIALADYRIMPPYESTPQETKQKLGKQGMEIAADFVDSDCLTRFTDKAIEYIKGKSADARNGHPFFLYLPYTSPHKPVIPRAEFRGQGAAGAYGEFMIETDFHVRQLLQCLDDEQLADNTLIIFTSDNGPETTWKQRIEKYGHDSSGVYRDGKRSIYEGGHRVPFLVRWPAGIESPGRMCDSTICQTDVLATLAELLNTSLPENAGEDSQSFLSLLQDASVQQTRVPLISHAANGRFAVRDGNWKLVMPHQRKQAELYNLKSDPGEERDLHDAHPDVAERLTTRITELVCTGRSTPGRSQPNDTGYWTDLSWISADEYGALTNR